MINHNENEDANEKQITWLKSRPWTRHEHKYDEYQVSQYDDATPMQHLMFSL